MNGLMNVIWIAALVTFILIEAATFSLTSVWFAVGALAAVIASALGASVAVQIYIFVGVSFVTLILSRPMVKKFMSHGYTPTNGELDIGKNAIVIERIDPVSGTGRVRLGGVDWGAKSADGAPIEEGETVTVTGKGSAFLTVSRSYNN